MENTQPYWNQFIILNFFNKKQVNRRRKGERNHGGRVRELVV